MPWANDDDFMHQMGGSRETWRSLRKASLIQVGEYGCKSYWTSGSKYLWLLKPLDAGRNTPSSLSMPLC